MLRGTTHSERNFLTIRGRPTWQTSPFTVALARSFSQGAAGYPAPQTRVLAYTAWRLRPPEAGRADDSVLGIAASLRYHHACS